jgi:hypothetical protein
VPAVAPGSHQRRAAVRQHISHRPAGAARRTVEGLGRGSAQDRQQGITLGQQQPSPEIGRAGGDHSAIQRYRPRDGNLSAVPLADDPWTPMGLLRIVKIVPWRILLGGDRAD